MEKQIPPVIEIQPKKKGFWNVLKKVGLFLIPLILKNQKGIKGTDSEKVVDKATDVLQNL